MNTKQAYAPEDIYQKRKKSNTTWNVLGLHNSITADNKNLLDSDK